MPLYRQHGREEDCRIELYDCARVELPLLCHLLAAWMDIYLVSHAAKA